MDDVALVAAVQGGDEEALADLYEECRGWTYSTCLNALRDPDAAEEATARVFEVAIRTRLAGAYALRPAMIRLIHDACTEVEQELRARRSRKRGEQPPAAPDPKDLRLVAWRAAGDLTPADRILFALAAGMALTNESIALAVSPAKPAAVTKRLDAIREHVVADVLAARSLDDCADLRDTLRYSAKEPDAAARKKVHQHLAGRGRRVAPCAKCTKAYERWPLAALAALLPLTALPPGLGDRLLDRMELALRAENAVGRDRARAVTATVIDGTIAVAGAPRRPAVEPPQRPSARPARAGAGTTSAGPARAGAGTAANDEAVSSRGAAGADSRVDAGVGSRTGPEAGPRVGVGSRDGSGERSRGGGATGSPVRGGGWWGPPSGAGEEPLPAADNAPAGGTAGTGASSARASAATAAGTSASGAEAPGARASGARASGTGASGTGAVGATAAAAGATAAPAAGSGSTAGPRPGRTWPVTTAVVFTATVLFLGVATVATLSTYGAPSVDPESLAMEPAAPTESPAAVRSDVDAAPGAAPTTPAGSPVEEPIVRTSPRATRSAVKQSIQPVARSAAPSPSTDPFRAFGALDVQSPVSGSTVGLTDPDARLASVVLSVAAPDGVDAAVLDSALTWSGSYVLQQETQYVELGSGQGITVDLQAAARCTTVWSITATLTPPTGAPQYATTEVSITC